MNDGDGDDGGAVAVAAEWHKAPLEDFIDSE